MQLTLDGNHHLNKYLKNTDPHDISLFEGRAYFPEDAKFRRHIGNGASGEEEEVLYTLD